MSVTIPPANKTSRLFRMTGRTGKPQPVEMTATLTMSTTRTRGT
ncbi:rCG31947 [Rattus norvegicus]|uniref:RCG31947 n=1 Tax=Rattus norvegicus TaxID=10116 RepID=A6KDS4_RAT|nr:rCG31947 [Rattus norvegicus]